MCTLHGVTWLHVEQTPTCDFAKSARVKPTACSIARPGARSGPSRTREECGRLFIAQNLLLSAISYQRSADQLRQTAIGSQLSVPCFGWLRQLKALKAGSHGTDWKRGEHALDHMARRRVSVQDAIGSAEGLQAGKGRRQRRRRQAASRRQGRRRDRDQPADGPQAARSPSWASPRRTSPKPRRASSTRIGRRSPRPRRSRSGGSNGSTGPRRRRRPAPTATCAERCADSSEGNSTGPADKRYTSLVRIRAVIILLGAAVFFVLPATLDFLADWLWFGEVGYQQVYATEIRARALAGVVVFAVAMAWFAGACAPGAGLDVAGADGLHDARRLHGVAADARAGAAARPDPRGDRVVSDRLVRVKPVDDAPLVVEPGAVRQGGPSAWPRCGDVCLYAAGAANCCGAMCMGLVLLAAAACAGPVFRVGPGRPHALRAAHRRSSAPAPRVARHRALPRAGAWRLARPVAGDRRAVGNHPGRQLR